MARYKYQGAGRDGNGKVIQSGTVSVYLTGTTTAASVYAAESGGAAVNSVLTDSKGYFSFWVDDGDYSYGQLFAVTLSKTNFESQTVSDIAIVSLLSTNVVTLSGAQNITGVKTFTVSPVVPTPTTDMQASTKKYGDDTFVALSGDQTVAGVKTLSSAPIMSALTANKAVVTGADKSLASSAVSGTELGYVSGVTSSIQTQFNAIGTPGFTNLSFDATVASKALTIALKGEDGNDPSGANAVKVKFRSSTLTDADPVTISTTSALSVVLPDGGTLGFIANEADRIYVWAINNAGTVELAVSKKADIFPESSLVTTVAIGTGSDSATAIYSTTQRTSLACKLIGYIEITTGGVAGEWDNAPTKVQVMLPGVFPDWVTPFKSGVAVASTSGASIDFTGIPSWVKRITVMLAGVSTNGTSNLLIQLGDSGGPETSGYISAATGAGGAGPTSSTSGLILSGTNYATGTFDGAIILSLQNAATYAWVGYGNFGQTGGPNSSHCSGSKALSAILDRIRVTTINGTDAFDAGLINILYE